MVSSDLQSEGTFCGWNIRFFNVIDEYCRTTLAIIPRRSFTADDVVPVLENIIAEAGPPRPTSGVRTGPSSPSQH